MECVENREIKVKVKLEASDFIELNRAVIKSKRKVKKYFRGFSFYIILFVIILAVLTLTSNSNKPTTQPDTVSQPVVNNLPPFLISMLPTFIFVIIMGTFIFLIPFLTKKAAKKQYESNKQMQKEFEYTINEDGLEGHSESSSFRYTWDEIHKVLESKNAFAVFQSNVSAFVIPKRCFFDENTIESMRKLLKSKIPAKNYETVKY